MNTGITLTCVSSKEAVVADCQVRPVRSPSDLRQFKRLPHRLNGLDPHWVRPLQALDDSVLDRERHPFYDQGRGASAEFFLACDAATSRPVGRIAAILNHRLNQRARQQEPTHEPCGHFGFFDCINSAAVARRLIDAASAWLRTQGARRMVGPASPSESYDYGLLVEGYDHPHRFLSPYHPPYYADLMDSLQSAGLRRAKDFLSLSADLHDPAVRGQVEQFIARTDSLGQRRAARDDLLVRRLDMRRFEEESQAVLAVTNQVLARTWGFASISRGEWDTMAKSLRHFINPDFCLLAEQGGKPVGVTLAVPDLNEIIRRLRFRWTGSRAVESLEFVLRAWRWRPQAIRILVTGVLSGENVSIAAAAVMVGQLARNLLAHGVRFVDADMVLEDNRAMLDPLLQHGFHADRRFRIYQMAL